MFSTNHTKHVGTMSHKVKANVVPLTDRSIH